MTDTVVFSFLLIAFLLLLAAVVNGFLIHGMAKQLDGRLTHLMELNRIQAGDAATIKEKERQGERDSAQKTARAMMDVYQQGRVEGRPDHDERRP